MSIASLLGALASETRRSAIMLDDPVGSRVGYCYRKAELFRLAADGYAQAAAHETESANMVRVWQSRAAKASADAEFWMRHAKLHEEIEAVTFEPA
jgi:hypothetical protein